MFRQIYAVQTLGKFANETNTHRHASTILRDGLDVSRCVRRAKSEQTTKFCEPSRTFASVRMSVSSIHRPMLYRSRVGDRNDCASTYLARIAVGNQYGSCLRMCEFNLDT
jgi:hypothetical protein